MSFDWESKLRHMTQVLAFCMVIATVQYAFQPDKPYGPPVIYSLFIGTITWAIIDLGRHAFPSSAETGWPQGYAGVLIVMLGIAGGWFIGATIAGRLCVLYGFYGPGTAPSTEADLRNSILITAMSGVVGSFFFYSRNRSAYLERKMGEAKKHANEARLKLLETQLEPHMLFNTLANLRALIAVDPTRAQSMLDHMIAYLRATLDASRSTSHTLQSEFDRLRDYLELMAIRMGPRLAFSLELPPELAQHPVPALLLQPLVENSIKHGLEPQLAGGRITVSARRAGAQLVLEVADTGAGPSGSSDAPKGYGMSHVRERLQTLYGQAASAEFGPGLQGGSRTTLRFPLATMTAPIALIAEDEPLLAQALQAELARAWPELQVAAIAGDGASAVTQALALRPDVLFFDIRMPGQSGLEAAAELADEWPVDLRFPALVFVTAYDQYAVQAFETQAVDYVLKPVQSARLMKTVKKLQEALAQRAEAPGAGNFEATLGQLRELLGSAGGSTAPQTPLKLIQASVGTAIRMVPVEEVVYFEAADKYVRVLTEAHEYLIRTPLKELLPQLDDRQFWQVHRGSVVRASAIDTVTRDEAGKLHLALRGRKERLAVSRLYAHLFKAM